MSFGIKHCRKTSQLLVVNRNSFKLNLNVHKLFTIVAIITVICVLVFRRQGSNQVVLNTLLWPEMCYDKAGSKSLRLTALDADTEKIHIYLVTVSYCRLFSSERRKFLRFLALLWF